MIMKWQKKRKTLEGPKLEDNLNGWGKKCLEKYEPFKEQFKKLQQQEGDFQEFNKCYERLKKWFES